ncbi:sigma-54-dependent Fis family transcriptional regulator [Pleomorphomonas diazotrophica]|uniref:Sigma-54-dependent Fis family transcriptional regulator n=1 Tax=Pleomorphomonas diazotrophica TaxID=1166257 RepID=A0A1I4UTJ4_9HYPH|nr:sigma-54 dependent transcriptional regulator [Pleomorphomonas diazotrophica]PKR89840.1 sigma-54-dependent Fis family transcriptional regulator [Pleomorphomonas diazotrophica]SFM92271.1 DNA-binding transcriptional response regulator, NtrC family, contains REC, AAA-type ATPase, and a Fis-type DNA-binding domains [Pleomorphomonas diazotrophica]
MRLLIVGSLNGQLTAATRIAMDKGASVLQADTIDTALRTLRSGRGADLVMIDVSLPIQRLITSLEEERIHVPVVACGIATDAKAAVAAIRAGAKEYIPLPPDAELIAAVLSAVTADSRDLVVRDEAMQAVLKLADQVAGSEASILITGESGTGKEVLARYVHRKSARVDKPFVSVNCAAIPENLLESELFGHEKGAFTGAVARRVGKFEEASGGTLLLDEISEMDVRLQAKLLRAIQERMIDRVGGGKPVPVDIRIIATSNRNLADAVKEGRFREDLLYRLNVVNLKIPSLRDRPADILALAEHFGRKYAEINGMPERPLSADAKRELIAARWPGNVRELENTIHRAVLLASGIEIGVEAIRSPDGARMEGNVTVPRSTDPAARAAQTAEAVTRALVGRTVAEVERDLILDTLDHCLGNRTHAAKILGISIRTLRNKLNEYEAEGIDVPDPGTSRIATA